MVDYTKDTGSSGTMMIRDTGTTVEFWLKAGSSTFNNSLPWGYTINGNTSGWLSFRFESGGSWQRLGWWTVTTDQTVTFRLGDSGTSGLGGPTTLSATISRVSAPNQPSTPTVSGITSTSVNVTYVDGDSNGSAINARQIGYGTNGASPTTIVASDRFDTINGLSPGTLYYVWARIRNSVGWSPWSGRRAFTTLKVPDAPARPAVSNVTQVSARVTFSPPTNNGGAAIVEYQVGYGVSSGAPVTAVSATSPKVISNLVPGTKYYFWVRARNSVGWGPWSASNAVTTLAGARILVGGVWKTAVPYVRVGGVWKLARPWTRSTGIWRESS